MTTPPPLTVCRWTAGLIEITAALIEHLGIGIGLLSDGVQAIADHLDPRPLAPDDEGDTDEAPTPKWVRVIDGDHIHYIPLDDSIVHDQSEDCPCGPATRLQMTGRGDVWHIGHHRLNSTPATEGA